MSAQRYVVPASLAWVVDGSEGEQRIMFALMDDLSAIVLDGSAALIWQLASEMPHNEIAAAVSEATGEPVSAVSAAVEEFLDDLVSRKLLEPLPAV